MAGKFRPGPMGGVWRAIVKSFVKSEPAGTQVGSDPFGNRYFEIPPDPSRGKRRPVRWYDAPETNAPDVLGVQRTAGFDAQIPAEWESWLRMRRDDPPTDEQVLQSLALADLKKRNAAKLDAKHREEQLALGRTPDDLEVKPMDHEKTFWPKYAEYEIYAGEKQGEKAEEDRWKDYKNPYAEDHADSGGKPGKK